MSTTILCKTRRLGDNGRRQSPATAQEDTVAARQARPAKDAARTAAPGAKSGAPQDEAGALPREPLSGERIVEAALQLIDDEGLEALTMRALGQRLGVEAMALYYYFPNKAALLEAVAAAGLDVEKLFGGFVSKMAEAGATAGDRVIALGQRYVEFAQTHPAQFTLLFNTLPIGYDAWEEFMDGTSTFRIPQSAVQAGIDSGEFHPRPGYGRDEMAFHLWALVHGLAVLRQTRLRDLAADYETLQRTLLEQLVQSFRGAGQVADAA
jgi:AcrR family transcriptional regulator